MRVGVGPKFQIKFEARERLRLQGAPGEWRELTAEELGALALAGGNARWREDVALFAIPGTLRKGWWEKVAAEVTSAFNPGVELDAFIHELIDFAEFKELPLPEASEFSILVDDEPAPANPDGVSVLINLSEAPAELLLLGVPAARATPARLRLSPGEGCVLPAHVAALPDRGAGGDAPVFLSIRAQASLAGTLEISRENTLHPGVKIYCCLPEGESAATRVLLSSGTYSNDPVTDEKYVHKANLPKLPWRRPNEEETKVLWTREFGGTAESTVAILRIPRVLYEPFLAMRTGELKTSEEYAKLRQTAEFRDAVLNVLNFVESYRQKEGPFEIAAIFAPTGLPAITMDHQVKKYIGLHFDDWDHLPLSGRGDGQNRILINLGAEDREFMFVNLAMRDLVLAVRAGGAEISDHHSEWRAAVKLFLAMYPNYPVVKIRIGPGEAYIAPTENVIHDGSTWGRRHPDVNLQVRGYIWPKGPVPVYD